jgi:hypothetical protein
VKEFTEEQKMTQWWLWLLILGVSVLPFVGIYQQVYRGEPWGDKPSSDLGLIIMAGLMLSLILLFWSFKLKTRIDNQGIRIKFVPFVDRYFQWSEIQSAEVVNYGFVGGWGIRLGTKYGTVYNIKGNKGLALQMKSGQKYLVGTQKETELRSVLESLELS